MWGGSICHKLFSDYLVRGLAPTVGARLRVSRLFHARLLAALLTLLALTALTFVTFVYSPFARFISLVTALSGLVLTGGSVLRATSAVAAWSVIRAIRVRLSRTVTWTWRRGRFARSLEGCACHLSFHRVDSGFQCGGRCDGSSTNAHCCRCECGNGRVLELRHDYIVT